MRVLLVPDKKDWSYFAIAQALVKHNTDPELTIDVMALKGHVPEFWEREQSADRLLIMGHQMLELLDSRFFRAKVDGERYLTGIHSHHAFDSALKTDTDRYYFPPPKWLIRRLEEFRGVNVVSSTLQQLFESNGLRTTYTPNGVDCDLFKPTAPLSMGGPLRVGVAYTPKHDRRKGVSEFIRPACEKAGAVLVEAKARSEQHVKPEDMPAWYQGIDLYCCMSSSEGFSIAVLEAAACGRPIISTRVGGSTELIKSGTNGFLVDRTIEAIADRLTWLQENRDQLYLMGLEARSVAVADWSWQKRAPAWLDFIRS
mgnify:CR=1 FL=1